MNLDDFPFDEIIQKSNSGEEFIDNINELAGSDSDAVINIYFKLCDMIGLNNKLSLEAIRDFEAMHGISILPNFDKILEKLK